MPQAVALVTDLIFASKITGTANALSVEAVAVPTVQALSAALDQGGVRLVMVDMSLPAETTSQALRLAAVHPSKPVTLAFYSHVQAAQADAARQVGASLVMPRSAFSADLPGILRRYCTTDSAGA